MIYKVFRFLYKPRGFKYLFALFFFTYICLFLVGFVSGEFRDETVSRLQLGIIVLALCILGGLMAAGAWMLVSSYARTTPYYLKNKDKLNDR
ncbi:MAG: hypothetical protein ABJN69_02980 [Hellea sp.]